MNANNMKSSEKVTVLRSVLDADLDDVEKVYFVQSFLLGWTDSDRIAEVVSRREATK